MILTIAYAVVDREAGIAAEYRKGRGLCLREADRKPRADRRGDDGYLARPGGGSPPAVTGAGRGEAEPGGHNPVEVRTAERGRAIAAGDTPAAGPGGEAALSVALFFGQEPSSAPEWCVSYAWGDDTPDGRNRTAIVDRLCAEAGARGVRILRDKNAMGLGERISKFMKRIGRTDRVFAVLSDQYLKSAFCMFELSEVWRTSRQEDEEFLKRIRVYTLPCARIWTPLDRARYAIYWKKKYDELDALVTEHGYDILGERDWQQFRRMREFSRNVGDILATVADILQPRSFDDLVTYGFDGTVAKIRSRRVKA